MAENKWWNNNRGRPKKNKDYQRSIQIRVRMSALELYRIKKRAKELGMTISGLMRAGALTYIPNEEVVRDDSE